MDQPTDPKGQDEPLEDPKKALLNERIIRVYRDNPKAASDDDLVTNVRAQLIQPQYKFS